LEDLREDVNLNIHQIFWTFRALLTMREELSDTLFRPMLMNDNLIKKLFFLIRPLWRLVVATLMTV